MKRSLLLLCSLLLDACGAPDAPPRVADLAKPETIERFADYAGQSELGFLHETGATGLLRFPEIMGSGAALFDFDNDGDLDVYFVQSEGAVDASSVNRLFRNDLIPTGRLVFSDITDTAEVGDNGYGMGVAVADIDNDGDQDLFVTNVGPNVLYRNNGDGTFTEATPAAARLDDHWSTSAAFADIDVDGDLDLYVANYVAWSEGHNVACTGHAGQRDYCDPSAYSPQRDQLWRNNGNGRFVDISKSSGIAEGFGNGLGVTAADFNEDGWPDIYVANDQTANNLWVNQKDGTFLDQALISGCAYNADGAPEASMGVTAGDYDGDGDEDLFMTHLGNQTNTMYTNTGDGGFVDSSDMAGLSVPSLGYTGFGAAFVDVDNDGDLDLFSANGAVQIEPAQAASQSYPYLQRNQIFINDNRGRFADVSAWSGAAMQVADVSRGAAFGDIDNDGDSDILVTNNKGPARLLINLSQPTAWLGIRLIGTTSSRDAAGARVAVMRSDETLFWRRAHTDGSYLSASVNAGAKARLFAADLINK